MDMENKVNCSEFEATQQTSPKMWSQLSHLKYRVVKTIFLFMSWIALGLFSEVIGPAVPAIKNLTDTNYEEFGRALATRAAGVFAGSLFGGILADVFSHRRNLLIFTFLTIAGISTITLPICRTLSTLCLNLFIHGLSHGGFTTSGNPSLNALWKEKSSGPFNFMHAGYGIGASIAPVLLKSFDVASIPSIDSNRTVSQKDVNIRIPFLFVGAYCIVIAFVFCIYCFLPNPIDKSEIPFIFYETKPDYSSEVEDCKNANFHGSLSIYQLPKRLKSFVKTIKRSSFLLMFLTFVAYFGIVGNERTFGKFQFVYATEGSLQMSKSNGYLINALYWVAFTMGRIIVALMSLKLSCRILLMLEICGALVSSVAFSIWNNSQIIFFTFSTIFGLFESPLFPTMLGVLSLYVTVSGSLIMMVNFGSSIGAMVCQYVAGYLFQTYGHHPLPLLINTIETVLLCTFGCFLFVTRKWRKTEVITL